MSVVCHHVSLLSDSIDCDYYLLVSVVCHLVSLSLSGALAMEALHRQVLPFILRRLKEDVLHDLPPKIIQDYYCDLSPLQVRSVGSLRTTAMISSHVDKMC